jgi:hypothetical protein
MGQYVMRKDAFCILAVFARLLHTPCKRDHSLPFSREEHP